MGSIGIYTPLGPYPKEDSRGCITHVSPICWYPVRYLTALLGTMMLAGTDPIQGPISFVFHVNSLIIGITRFSARFVAQFRNLRPAGWGQRFRRYLSPQNSQYRKCQRTILIIVEHVRSKTTSEHTLVRSFLAAELGKEMLTLSVPEGQQDYL